jgi:hypothetical protein
MAASQPLPTLREADLHRWELVEAFRDRLTKVVQQRPLPASWSDQRRLLKCGDYLGLFLFGLLNPVVGTMRGLCAASRLERVQREVCSRPVSLGSFSEAQALLEPELLQEVFLRLTKDLSVGAEPALPGRRSWLIQDGSLFDALPRMYWALWRRQGKAQSQVRLHLSLDMDTQRPARAVITNGKTCERAAWRTQWKRGDGYVGDRYYAENYQLFEQMQQAGVAFVVRLRDEAVIEMEEELPLSATDLQANLARCAWVRVGCKRRYQSIRLRAVWVQTPKETLRLVTNLGPEELTAAEVALLYKQRWQIELFFRWVKCILGCRHWLAESPQGVAVEIYLALIAALLLQLYTGQRPNRRMMELIRFYLLGVATLDELEQGIERELAQLARRKKS